jgi:molecular chaperone HscB
MEYFEIFGLPPRLDLDLADLQRRFHEMSRTHHPDYHTTRSAEEQERALRTTALINDAYRTLRDPTRRVEYLVRSSGLAIDGSKVPRSLLAEVFEINEELEEVRRARVEGRTDEARLENLRRFRETIVGKRREYEGELAEAARFWDSLADLDENDEQRKVQLGRLADIVARSAYLRNLEREMEVEVSA